MSFDHVFFLFQPTTKKWHFFFAPSRKKVICRDNSDCISARLSAFEVAKKLITMSEMPFYI